MLIPLQSPRPTHPGPNKKPIHRLAVQYRGAHAPHYARIPPRVRLSAHATSAPTACPPTPTDLWAPPPHPTHRATPVPAPNSVLVYYYYLARIASRPHRSTTHQTDTWAPQQPRRPRVTLHARRTNGRAPRGSVNRLGVHGGVYTRGRRGVTDSPNPSASFFFFFAASLLLLLLLLLRRTAPVASPPANAQRATTVAWS